MVIAVEEEEPASKVPKFTPFTGSGKRLDGKTQTESTEQEDKPTVKGKDDELSTPTPPQKSGKLVFGSNSKQASKASVKVCLSFLDFFHSCDPFSHPLEIN